MQSGRESWSWSRASNRSAPVHLIPVDASKDESSDFNPQNVSTRRLQEFAGAKIDRLEGGAFETANRPIKALDIFSHDTES